MIWSREKKHGKGNQYASYWYKLKQSIKNFPGENLAVKWDFCTSSLLPALLLFSLMMIRNIIGHCKDSNYPTFCFRAYQNIKRRFSLNKHQSKSMNIISGENWKSHFSELLEDSCHEPVTDGVTFYVRYLGCCGVPRLSKIIIDFLSKWLQTILPP